MTKQVKKQSNAKTPKLTFEINYFSKLLEVSCKKRVGSWGPETDRSVSTQGILLSIEKFHTRTQWPPPPACILADTLPCLHSLALPTPLPNKLRTIKSER